MQAIHYPLFDKTPEVGSLIHLGSNVKWVKMPLPFALNHINLWLLRDCIGGRQGWTLVDTGIGNQATREAWLKIFENELEGLPIIRILITHMHPDHIGLAEWLSEYWNIRVSMSLSDYAVARWLVSPQGLTLGSQAGGGGAADFFMLHGLLDQDDLEKIRARSDYFSKMVPAIPKNFHRLMGGQQLMIGEKVWQIIVGYGHAPEHLSFWCPSEKMLISGDMVLPRISTNVSVYDSEPEANPLKLYLDSLAKYLPLNQDTLVLPSHGKPFLGLHHRIKELEAHHQERLADTLEACTKKPLTARELVPILFRRELDLHQLTFAMGEAIAHLNFLWLDGRLKRETCEQGILRFSSILQ